MAKGFGLSKGQKLLKYRANWGYASWQFSRAGFNVTSFEISHSMAAFGANLYVEIHTDIAAVGSGFDAVYSSHVLEHTPNPMVVLLEQLHPHSGGPYHPATSPNRLKTVSHPLFRTDEAFKGKNSLLPMNTL